MSPSAPPNSELPQPHTCVVKRIRVRTRDAGELTMALSVARVAPEVDSARALATTWLRGKEIERFERFKVEHARRDFLAGRIAAKRALARLHDGCNPLAIEIRRGIWHQPSVRGAGDGVAVTLAHSGGQAVAIAFDDRLRCGIDLEENGRDVADVVATQVSPAEAAWARDGDDDATLRWLLLWTAREAIGKCFGTGLLFGNYLPATAAWQQEGAVWHAALQSSDLLTIRSFSIGKAVVSMVVPLEIAAQDDFVEAVAWMAGAMA